VSSSRMDVVLDRRSLIGAPMPHDEIQISNTERYKEKGEVYPRRGKKVVLGFEGKRGEGNTSGIAGGRKESRRKI